MKVWCLWTESDKKSNHKINESDKTVWRGPDSLKSKYFLCIVGKRVLPLWGILDQTSHQLVIAGGARLTLWIENYIWGHHGKLPPFQDHIVGPFAPRQIARVLVMEFQQKGNNAL